MKIRPLKGTWSTRSDEVHLILWSLTSGPSNEIVSRAMIQTTHTCRKCGSADIVKNGHSKNGHSASGSQQYRCKSCGAYLVLDPPCARSEAKRLFRGRKSPRKKKSKLSRPTTNAARKRTRLEKRHQPHFGVSRNTLSRWLKKRIRSRLPSRSGSLADQVEPAEEEEVLEASAGPMSASDRTNDGFGSPSADELDKLSPL